MSTHLSPNIILSDSHGRYIPQIFCEDADEEWAQSVGVDYSDVETCQAGPDHEWYYEAWESILNSCSYTDDKGTTWRLIHDGDLYEVPDGYSWDHM